MESKPSPLGQFTQKQQLAFVAGLCGLALGVAGVISVLTMGRAKPAAAAATETGVFRPTREQWQALTTAPVQMRAFNALSFAEGHIEADGEKTTPVISPFTGRVLEVLAVAGQKVDRRTPLFTVAAAEVVQGRSDLATALAGLDTAQAQLKLARETETRQGELYRNAGGALKDWRQAQSDAIAAEGQHHLHGRLALDDGAVVQQRKIEFHALAIEGEQLHPGGLQADRMAPQFGFAPSSFPAAAAVAL